MACKGLEEVSGLEQNVATGADIQVRGLQMPSPYAFLMPFLSSYAFLIFTLRPGIRLSYAFRIFTLRPHMACEGLEEVSGLEQNMATGNGIQVRKVGSEAALYLRRIDFCITQL